MIWICPNCGVEHDNKIALCHECFQERQVKNFQSSKMNEAMKK